MSACVRPEPQPTREPDILDMSILFGRHDDGAVFAFHDSCPHRGMPLRHGRMDHGTLSCCFHGWQFDTSDGRCIEQPRGA